MAEASLLFVREDRAVAEKLARILEAEGVSICASASAYESPHSYDATIALFSSAAVRSRLLMEMALEAEAAGKLVPVFVGFCHLQAPLNRLMLHDLCEWDGEAEAVALQAIRAHVMRIARARAAGGVLRPEAPRGADPLAFEPPPAAAAETPASPQTSARPAPQPDHGPRIEPIGAGLGHTRRAPRTAAPDAIPPPQAASFDTRPAEPVREPPPRPAPRQPEPDPDTDYRDLGDPFAAQDAAELEREARVDIEPFEPPRFGLSEWASDALVMIVVTTAALAAIAAAAQPQIMDAAMADALALVDRLRSELP